MMVNGDHDDLIYYAGLDEGSGDEVIDGLIYDEHKEDEDDTAKFDIDDDGNGVNDQVSKNNVIDGTSIFG